MLKTQALSEVLNSICVQLKVNAAMLVMERERLQPLMENFHKAEHALAQFIDNKIIELDNIIKTVSTKQETGELAESAKNGAEKQTSFIMMGP